MNLKVQMVQFILKSFFGGVLKPPRSPNISVSVPKFHLQFHRIEKSLVFALLAFWVEGAATFRFSIKPLSNTLSLVGRRLRRRGRKLVTFNFETRGIFLLLFCLLLK